MKLVIVTLSLLLAIAASAADTGTLILQGVVAPIASIVVTPNGTSNTTLNITGGETSKLVASVAETCNSALGYKINVKSDNGSELRNTSDPTYKTTYQLGYDGQTPITLTTSYQQVKEVTMLNGLTTNNSQVHVDVTALPNALSGTYLDTVTFQIVAN